MVDRALAQVVVNPMKRPLVNVALLYACGILLARGVSIPVAPAFALAGCLAVSSLCFHRAWPWILGAFLVVSGAVNLAWHTAILSPHDLRRLLPAQQILVSIRGRLAESPSERVFERNGQSYWRTMAVIDVDQIEYPNQWQKAYGRVAVTTRGRLTGCWRAGHKVQLQGALGAPALPVVEGLFDYRSYLRWQGIYYQLKVETEGDWQSLAIGDARIDPWTDRFQRWAQATLARGLPEEDDALRLIWAMMLGWKTGLTPELAQPFMRTGTMHIFAISGLHVALISGILVSVLRVLQMPRAACGACILPLIWCYAAATGWQSSAIRSTVMMTVIIAGWGLKRPSDLLNSLLGAAFILLLWEPRQLFQASFQLSFVVVLCLALCQPKIDSWRAWWLQADPMVPQKLASKWSQCLRYSTACLGASFITSLAAWIGSLPLIAHYFHLMTPSSLVANLIVVPLSSLALSSHLASLCCGLWFPAATELFNFSGWFWMKIMIVFCQWASQQPLAYWHVPSPNPEGFVLYYGAAFAFLSGTISHPRWGKVLIATLAGLGLVWAAQGIHELSLTRLTILSIDGGDALFLDGPGRRQDLLVDGGTSSAAGQITIPYLQSLGVNRLYRCVLTHGDNRHVGGSSNILAAFPHDLAYINPIPGRSQVYRRILKQWEQQGQALCSLDREAQKLEGWTVLHPHRTDKFARADDGAIVLMGIIRGTRILLLSDLGLAGQEVLLEREPHLQADLVVAGIPSQDEPLCDQLLDRIQPRFIVLSASALAPGEQALEPLRARLAQRGIPVLYTSEAGTVHFYFSNSGCIIRCANTNSVFRLDL